MLLPIAFPLPRKVRAGSKRRIDLTWPLPGGARPTQTYPGLGEKQKDCFFFLLCFHLLCSNENLCAGWCERGIWTASCLKNVFLFDNVGAALKCFSPAGQICVLSCWDVLQSAAACSSTIQALQAPFTVTKAEACLQVQVAAQTVRVPLTRLSHRKDYRESEKRHDSYYDTAGFTPTFFCVIFFFTLIIQRSIKHEYLQRGLEHYAAIFWLSLFERDWFFFLLSWLLWLILHYK